MADEETEKLDTKDFLSALIEINQRLASIETSLNTFPAKFDKMEDRLERYHESAINADNKAEKAYLLSENNESELKLAKATAELAEDKADKAQLNIETLSKELKEYKEGNEHSKDTSVNVWVAIGTAVLGAIVSVWGFFK